MSMNKLTRSTAGAIIASMTSKTYDQILSGASEFGSGFRTKQRKRRKSDRRKYPHGF